MNEYSFILVLTEHFVGSKHKRMLLSSSSSDAFCALLVGIGTQDTSSLVDLLNLEGMQ
jgi:hypothetical protein